MPNKILITVLLFVVALAGLASSAVAARTKLSGSLELRYGAHTATESGSKVLDASHFTQKYSFLAEKQGLLADGRLGRYAVALGYEWSWVDSKQGLGVKTVINNPLDKLLYRGEIEVSPGGLPFSLRAYSYDMNSTTFDEDDLGELFDTRAYSIGGGTVTNIRNGSQVVTGFTLQAGTGNGHYEGQFREVLSSLPLFLVDFRQVDVHDLKSLNPTDYTDRDLAFVSLNKKNNWIHFKIFDHDNRIDPSSNFREQTFIIGTIDQHERRQWVNVTNWIEVSADISYSETLPESVSSSNLQYQRRYDVNLFSKAQRTRWRGSSFTTYSRVNDGKSLDRSLIIPLYASGALNRDTAWRISLINSRSQSRLLSGGVDQQTDDISATVRLDTFRQSRYIFSPMVAAEVKQGLDGEGYAVRAGAEFRSNHNYRSVYELFGRYEARWFTGTGELGLDVDYLEQIAEGKIEKDFNSQLRGGISQDFIFADGVFDSSVANTISADSDSILNHKGISGGTVFRSLTTLFVDHRSLRKLNNRVELTLDHQSSPSLSGQQIKLGHRLNYRKGAWVFDVNSTLSFGDELATTAISLGEGLEDFFTNVARFSYRPSRAVKSQLEVGYEQRSFSDGSDSERYRVRESVEYTLWNYNGLVRQLAVFGQEIELFKSLKDSTAIGDNYTGFTLFTNYYPTRISLLSAKLHYNMDSSADNDTFIVFLSAGLDFQKLKLSLDYSYGDRSSGGLESDRTEHRWEVKVNKLF